MDGNKKHILRLCCTILVVACLFYGYAYVKHQQRVIAQLRMNVGLAFNKGYEQGRVYEQIKAMETIRRLEGSLANILSQYPHCTDPEQWTAWITQYSYTYQVPSIVLLGVICQESSCNPKAVSHVGAVGLTQIRWRFWGEFLAEQGIADKRDDLFNPETAIHAGAAILGHLLDKYDGDIHEALDHYSGGAKDYYRSVVKRVVGGGS